VSDTALGIAIGIGFLAVIAAINLRGIRESMRFNFALTLIEVAGLLLVAEPLRLHYEASLTERGRDDLLASPLPEVGEIWETDVTPPRVFGIRRPWQPEKSSRAQQV
jgi:hypothetical protein